jgi:hypothetical protein
LIHRDGHPSKKFINLNLRSPRFSIHNEKNQKIAPTNRAKARFNRV